jgi:hypothetical protein
VSNQRDHIDRTKKQGFAASRSSLHFCFSGRKETSRLLTNFLSMTKAKFLQKLERLMQYCPYRSQESEADPRFEAKLFDIA